MSGHGQTPGAMAEAATAERHGLRNALPRAGQPPCAQTEPGLISVLMTAYNAEAYVGAAVGSLLVQTDAHFEIVVVDDGSSDETVQVLEQHADPRLRVHRAPHQGRVPALLHAAREARGELLAILDADDLALPERLATQRRYLALHPEVALVGSAAIEFDGREEWLHPVPAGPRAVRRALSRYNPFFLSSVMFRRDVYQALGGFPCEAGLGYDFAFLVQVAERHPVDILPEPLIRYRRHPAQMTAGAQWESNQHRWAAAAQRDAAHKLADPGEQCIALVFPLLHALYYHLPPWLRSRRLKDAVKYRLLKLFRTF